MLKAIAVNFRVLHYADYLIKNNLSFLYKAIRMHEQAIHMLPLHVRYAMAHQTKHAAALYLHTRLLWDVCEIILRML